MKPVRGQSPGRLTSNTDPQDNRQEGPMVQQASGAARQGAPYFSIEGEAWLEFEDPGLAHLPPEASLDENAPRIGREAFGSDRSKRAPLWVSAGLHLALGVSFLAYQSASQLSGAQNSGTVLLGDAPEDQLASGEDDRLDSVDAVLIHQMRPEPAIPPLTISPSRLIASRAEKVRTVETAQDAPVPVARLSPARPSVAAASPAAATVAVSVSNRPELLKSASASETARTATMSSDPVTLAGQVAVETAEMARSATPAKIEPVIGSTEVARPFDAAARLASGEKPSPERPPSKSRRAGEATPSRARKPSARAPDSGGTNKSDAKHGQTDGRTSATAGTSGTNGKDDDQGNARVSNYPGKVVAHLRRRKKYPAGARGQRLAGTVLVGFTIGSSGVASQFRVLRSSGSEILDAAALDTARRASPYPPIPAEERRQLWRFSVPLAFEP